jgi:hypothetical protein
MNQPAFPRLGAACGAVFAIALFAANGDGSQAFSGPRAVAGIAALTLFIPFLCYLGQILHTAGEAYGWLAGTALAAGITGITLKLASGAPELALVRAHVAGGTELHRSIEAIAGGATLLSLYPLTVFCAVTAFVAFRTRILPGWLAAGAAVSAAALAANGAFLAADFVPALLLFLLWTLLTSLYLLRRAWHQPAHIAQPRAATTA